MKKKKVTIKCTEKQALIIEIALDVLSRMVAGQLDKIVDGIDHMKGKRKKVDTSKNQTLNKVSNALTKLAEDSGKMAGYKLGSHIANLIKPILFPELQRNESYGIGQKEIGDAQIAHEMVKILQNYRVRNMKDKWKTVLGDKPLHLSNEPLISVEEEK